MDNSSPLSELIRGFTDFAIYALDENGRITTWNAGAAKLTGWEDNEVLGQACARFYPAKHASKADAELKEAALHGRVEEKGWRVRKDGTTFWAHDILTAQRDAAGKVIGFLKISRDLTEEKKTLDALSQSEERHRLVVEDVVDYAIFMVDAEGRVGTWNTGAERILGYKDPEILGQPLATLFTPEDREAGEDVKEVETAASKGRALDARWHLRRDGTRLWVQGVLTAIRDETGKLRGFSKVMRDSTERKLLETTQRFLAGLGERLRPLATPVEVMCLSARAMCEHMSAARCYFAELDFEKQIARVLAEHHEPDLVELAGDYPLADIGLDMEELRRGNAVAISDLDSDPRTVPNYARVYEPQKTRAMLAVTQRRGPTSAWAIVVTARESPRLWSPAESELIGTVAERTWMAVQNAHLYENAQSAREQAEAAGRAKDEFLATLSHELRTPLMPVLSATHRMETDPEFPEKFRRSVEMIRRNVELEARLIDDLLDLSRIIHKKLEFTFERVDLHRAVQHALEMCEAEVAEKKLCINVELHADDHHVSGDAGRVQQVFWNLLKNAVKFTPEGGSVGVRSSNERAHICVEITDSGVGIDTSVLPKIFDPFEQGSYAVARQFGGLGLGLAIAKATVDAHGGRITVESAGPGQGATFTVELATLDEGNPPGPPPDTEPAAAAPPTLLPPPSPIGGLSPNPL